MNYFEEKDNSYHSYKHNGNYNLVNVWNNTKLYFEQNPREIPLSSKIDIYSLHGISTNFNANNEIAIEIVNDDSFNLGIKYINEGLNPLILNMASDYRPGGGVASGKTAQEEELFRRSNAHLTHHIEWYPLKPNEIIYSSEVTVIKDTRSNNYKFIDEIKMAMVACAAIRNPKLVNGNYTSVDYQLMSNKIESLFRLGIDKKHDSLVLGAFGCGAFSNPPDEVAKIFSKMVNKYRNYYKKIGFAILVVKPSDTNNINSFKKIFYK